MNEGNRFVWSDEIKQALTGRETEILDGLGIPWRQGHPGGNVTGVTTLNVELGPKRLELLRELMPMANIMAVLVNPTNPNIQALNDLKDVARNIGQQILVVTASTQDELDAAFARLVQQRAGALLVNTDALFFSRRDQLAALATRYAVPAIYDRREFAVAGCLMSYGGSVTESYRLAGAYTARILRGQKPADLPVQQATAVELIINLRTAKAIGITVPSSLLTRADELID
jgi:putative tryptophan/tyrosine transport system substrate-binding protein